MNSGFRAWLPLTDDGDALRLAVKLKMDILCHESYGEVSVFCDLVPWALDNPFHEAIGSDAAAAARRAIVRAAATLASPPPSPG